MGRVCVTRRNLQAEIGAAWLRDPPPPVPGAVSLAWRCLRWVARAYDAPVTSNRAPKGSSKRTQAVYVQTSPEDESHVDVHRAVTRRLVAEWRLAGCPE